MAWAEHALANEYTYYEEGRRVVRDPGTQLNAPLGISSGRSYECSPVVCLKQTTYVATKQIMIVAQFRRTDGGNG